MSEVKFIRALKKNDIKSIYDYNLDVFLDTPDFEWTLQDLQNEVKEGWELYGVYVGEEIAAAVFLKDEKKRLYTKNSGLKINFQGEGISHKIKEFFEIKAKELKSKEIIHYCGIDNFRTYSLNESHGYHKIGNMEGSNRVVEWVKKV